MNNLKKIRLEKKLTQKDIANLINVTDTEVRRKEQGITSLNEQQIRKLCKVLKLSADYLIGLKNTND